MKSSKQIIGLLKSIYFVVIAIALMIIAYLISGGQSTSVSNVLFVAGIIVFFVGLFMGLINSTSSKDDSNE